MKVGYNEEQEELKRIVRQFLEEKSPESEVRRLMETDTGYDEAVWRQMADQMQLQGLTIPEEYGGSGYGAVELVAVMEEMGRSLLCAPFFSSIVLASNLLLVSGDEAAKKELLPKIANGDLLAAVAVTEENGRWDEEGVQMKAKSDGGKWTVSGTKICVIDGQIANELLVLARTGKGVSLFRVSGEAKGLKKKLLNTLDSTRKQARLEFKAVSATLVGTEGEAWDAWSKTLDLAGLALSAEQIGMGQFCLDMAVDYAKIRLQFSRPIGSFQSIKHMCADMFVELESARSGLYYAAACYAEEESEFPKAVSLLQAYASEMGFRIAADNIQIHGGIGFTWEHPAHLYYKRGKSSELLFGDGDFHRAKMMEHLDAEPMVMPGSGDDETADDEGDSPEAAAIRTEARAWFEANWDPEISLREWWERLSNSGWGFPTWPEEWYGKDLPSHLARVVAQESRRVGAVAAPTGIGPMMAGPTLAQCATKEQNERFLPDMVSGKLVWCQLFSEPGSGSDLASLQTRAVRDGDEWIINGQKVWTSGAQFSKWGILIARTDPDVPKHSGITYFVIDLEQPGVEVRPLTEMTGQQMFNEVFFTDARVPHANVIGEVNAGWHVGVVTLGFERNSLGAGGMSGGMGGGGMFGPGDLDKPAGKPAGSGGGEMAGMAAAFGGGGASMLKMLPGMFGKSGDPVVAQKMARLYTMFELSSYTSMRVQQAVTQGDQVGPEVSIGKIVASKMLRMMRDTALSIEGPMGMLHGEDAPLGGMIQFLSLFCPAISIAGGTDQVQANIIGERVLGLPPEARPDKEMPFKELEIGTRSLN